MKKLLLLLLIVGCDNSTESDHTCNNICDVAWVSNQDTISTFTENIVTAHLYYTEGKNLTLQDSIFINSIYNTVGNSATIKEICESNNEICSQNPNCQTVDCNQQLGNVFYYAKCTFNEIEFELCEEVNSITHNIGSNLFEVVKSSNDILLIDSTTLINFEYK